MDSLSQRVRGISVRKRWSWSARGSFVFMLLMLLLTAAVPIAISEPIAAQSNQPTAKSQSACAANIVSAADNLLAAVDSPNAIALAEQSPQFRTDLAGHDYQFFTIGAVASFDSATCGDVALTKLSVDFTVTGLYLTSEGMTVPQGITVFENPASTAVLDVTMDNSTVQGLSYFSGYESQYVVSGSAKALLDTEQYYYQPSIGHNSYCGYYSQYNTALQCAFSMWSGISANYGGGGFLVQSGTDNFEQCYNIKGHVGCNNPVYTTWWEWLPGHPPITYGGTLSTGDQVTPNEENMAFSGGPLNTYQANVIDWTANWVGLSGNLNVGQNAYWAQSEFEIPSIGSAALPTFSPITLDYVDLCWASNACADFGGSNTPTTTDSMINYCPSLGTNVQNILLSSFNIVGDYTQTYNTNCGT